MVRDAPKSGEDFGFRRRCARPRVRRAEVPLEIEIFRAGQPFGTKQIHPGNVNLMSCSGDNASSSASFVGVIERFVEMSAVELSAFVCAKAVCVDRTIPKSPIKRWHGFQFIC